MHRRHRALRWLAAKLGTVQACESPNLQNIVGFRTLVV